MANGDEEPQGGAKCGLTQSSGDRHQSLFETACPACASPQLFPWVTKRSPLDGLRFSLVKCGACNSAFVNPRPDPAYLEQFYSGNENSQIVSLISHPAEMRCEMVLNAEREFPNTSVDAKRFASYCRELSPGNRFLDVGAAFGFGAKAAQDRGFQVTAIEPSAVSVEIIRQMTGIEAVPEMLSETFIEANESGFDVVLMSQVLEHIPDLETTLIAIHKLLGPNGIAAIAVPHFGSLLSTLQGKNDMFIIPPEHVNFFSKKGLKALFERHGFTCSEIHTISRINMKRVGNRVPIPIARRPISQMIQSILHLSDHFDYGMFINAYFRKTTN